MFAFIERETAREHNRLFAAGIAYLLILASLMSVATAMYLKVFHRVTWVTVEAERAGMQLPKFGDVRMHGVIVGQVREISQKDGKAVIKLGLEPEAAKAIPTNSRIQIRPTTLFGQKYVEFVDPPQPGGPVGIRNGTVIAADRVETTVELERVLGRLSTLLTTVRPQDLNATLNAVATALSGNGEDLGRSLEKLDTYLGTMEDYIPTLREDLIELAEVSKTYANAAPDLLETLENATVTARTVREQRDELADLLINLTAVAVNGTALLRENKSGIELETKLAVPLLKLLEHYAPAFPCILVGLDRSTVGLDQIFRNSRVYQTMAFSAIQRPSYGVIDRPVWGDAFHKPHCLGLPDKAIVGNPIIKDGTEDNPIQHFRQGIR